VVFFTGALFSGEDGGALFVSATAATLAVSDVVVAIVSAGESRRERFAFIRMTSATAMIPSAPTLARNERMAGDIEMNIRSIRSRLKFFHNRTFDNNNSYHIMQI